MLAFFEINSYTMAIFEICKNTWYIFAISIVLLIIYAILFKCGKIKAELPKPSKKKNIIESVILAIILILVLCGMGELRVKEKIVESAHKETIKQYDYEIREKKTVDRFGDENTENILYYTINSGKDWTKVPSDMSINVLELQEGTYQIDDKKIIFAITSGRYVNICYQNDEKGLSWTNCMLESVINDAEVEQIKFTDNKNGKIVIKTSPMDKITLVTTNGGKTWKK